MAAPAESLEALVREELRGPVADLIRKLIPELVAEELNGHLAPAARATATAPERPEEAAEAAEATPGYPETGEPLRRCSTCHVEKPADQFSPGHYVCKGCRRKHYRDGARRKRAAQAEGSGEPEG